MIHLQVGTRASCVCFAVNSSSADLDVFEIDLSSSLHLEAWSDLAASVPCS